MAEDEIVSDNEFVSDINILASLESMSSYPPPPTSDANQQPYTPVYPSITNAQLQEAADAAEAVHVVQSDQAQDHTQDLTYDYLKADGTLADVQALNNGPTGHAPPTDAQGQEPHHKVNRLRKACDSCSVRKVKCDESGPPCKACAGLDIPCTFDRPSRRRGPPNRHAEAIKKRKVDPPPPTGISSPSSPTHAAQALAQLSATAPLSAESLCQLGTVDLLINDFFTFMYPLCPFPHEPSFREAFRRRDDCTNRSFLALLASMVGALVASYPRKPRLHIQDPQERDQMFPNHVGLAYRCQKVCLSARGESAAFRDDLNVYDAATSYFLGLSFLYTGQVNKCCVAFGECLFILRTLQPWEQQVSRNGTSENHVAEDFILAEMGKRIFWTLHNSVHTLQGIYPGLERVFKAPETDFYEYPPLPSERDDPWLHSPHVPEQARFATPVIVALNAKSRMLKNANLKSTSQSFSTFTQLIEQCKATISTLPAELSAPSRDHAPFFQGSENNAPRDPALMNPVDIEGDLNYRRQIHYYIQARDLQTTSYKTRIQLLRSFDRSHDRPASPPPVAQSNDPGELARVAAAGLDGLLRDQNGRDVRNGDTGSNTTATEEEVAAEWNSITKDICSALGDAKHINTEPHDDYYTTGLRYLAYLLISAPAVRQKSTSNPRLGKARLPVEDLLQALDHLEQVQPLTPEGEASALQMSAALELETEARCWEAVGTSIERLREIGSD
ncbi:MAG: hypothetical protein M1820_008074 [Bogoriella megaspora]|nr:MAG: hypothetical protein M1820_008074 [Bogoriella megaspora]